jgi:hypothetical protein
MSKKAWYAMYHQENKDAEPPYKIKKGERQIPICSILPKAYEAAENADIKLMIDAALPLAKYTVHMLVLYKRTYTEWVNPTHHDLYIPTEDYSLNPATPAAPTDILQFAESTQEYPVFLLYNYINHVVYTQRQIQPPPPELAKLLTKALKSSHSICTKLKYYTEKYGDEYLKDNKFDRYIPW